MKIITKKNKNNHFFKPTQFIMRNRSGHLLLTMIYKKINYLEVLDRCRRYIQYQIFVYRWSSVALVGSNEFIFILAGWNQAGRRNVTPVVMKYSFIFRIIAALVPTYHVIQFSLWSFSFPFTFCWFTSNFRWISFTDTRKIS